jgi:CHASE3 domain sensor protein
LRVFTGSGRCEYTAPHPQRPSIANRQAAPPEEIVREATKDGIAGDLPALTVTERKVRLGFAFALVCIALIGAVSYLSLARLAQQAVDGARAHETLGSLDSLLAAAADAQAAERGYVITGDERYWERYRRAVAIIEEQTTDLRRLTEGNFVQRQPLDAAAALVADQLQNLHSVMELRKDQGFAAAQREVMAGKDELLHERIRDAVAQMVNSQSALLAQHAGQARASAVLARAVIIGGGTLACGFAGWALLGMRRDFATRAQAATASHDADENLELKVRERTASEPIAPAQSAGGIAHDINNAISPVTLYIDALLESEPGLSARGRGQLEIIQRAVDEVARAVVRLRESHRLREP